MSEFRILAVNPGSTSTKIAVYEDKDLVFKQNIKHNVEELAPFENIVDQYEFRKNAIINCLKEKNYSLQTLSAVVARGGMLRPLTSGTYEVSDVMIEDLKKAKYGEHASNLGALISKELAREVGVPTYIVDPVCVDELSKLARFSGLKDLPRTSIFHALNVKAIARKYAESQKKYLNEVKLIVAHMGGGITVSAITQGKAVEVNHGLYEGPFTPERSGALPTLPFYKFCQNRDPQEVKEFIAGRGGLVNLIGTSDALLIEKKIAEGDLFVAEAYEAMAYQIAQEIGARATVLYGKVDAIILTGGLAYSTDYLVKWITDRVSFIAPVIVMPGENEMEALAHGALRVLRKEELVKNY